MNDDLTAGDLAVIVILFLAVFAAIQAADYFLLRPMWRRWISGK